MAALRLCVCVLAGALALPAAFAGFPRQELNEQSTPAPYVEPESTTVDVVILDRQGKPIDGLEKENFRLFEDGREQRILTFERVWESPASLTSEAGAAAADARERHGKVVLILFDYSAGLSVEQSNLARQEAEKYVQRHMRPHDWMGVAVIQRNLKIAQELTHDRERVIDAVRQMNATSTSGAPASVVDTASVNESKSHAKDVFAQLTSLISSLEAIQGRKAVLLFTADFEAPASSRDEFRDVVSRARDANVSFFTLDTAGRYSTTARRDNISFANTPPGSVDPNTDFVRMDLQTMTSHVLRSLADDTGGYPIYKVDGLADALDEVDLELSSYYVLGYQPDSRSHEERLRRIDVRVDVDGARTRYCSSGKGRLSADRLAMSDGRRVLADVLASPVSVRELPVSFRAVYFYESASVARVPVFAAIEAGAIRLRRKGRAYTNVVRVMGVACGEDGHQVARFSDELPVNLDEAGADVFRRQDVLYSNFLRLPPGAYRLKLAIAEEGGKRGSAEQSFTIPPLPASGWTTSSLVLTQEMKPLPALIRNVQMRLLNDSDPLLFRGYRIYVSVRNELAKQHPSVIFYRLYNPGVGETALPATAVLTLTDQQGEAHRFPPIDLKNLAVVARRGELAVGFRLPANDLPPGKYRLSVDTTVEASAPVVSSSIDLDIR